MILSGRTWLIGIAAVGLLAASAYVAHSQSAAGDGVGAAPAAAAAGQRFVLTSLPLTDRSAGIVVVDQATLRLVVYSMDAGTRQLKLLAVRDMSHDVQMSHWNNAKPWPEEIRQFLQQGDGTGPTEENR